MSPSEWTTLAISEGHFGIPDHRNEKGTRSTVEAMICGSVVEGVHQPLAEPGEFQGLAGRSWRAVVCATYSRVFLGTSSTAFSVASAADAVGFNTTRDGSSERALGAADDVTRYPGGGFNAATSRLFATVGSTNQLKAMASTT